MDISKKILSDPINTWILRAARELDTEVFIVGGYVRDLIRGVRSKDRDFVLEKNVKTIADKAAKKYRGTLIELKKQKTYRVVFKDKTKMGYSDSSSVNQREVIDFSYLKDTIYNDLKERDFTIDAIAWSQETGIIDLLSGRKDIEEGVIKAVRMKNLRDDPLRMLRAYRIAAELHFQIEEKAKKYIKNHSQDISKAAYERITDELFKILNNKNSGPYIYQSFKDTILHTILYSRQHVKAARNEYKKANTLNQNIKTLDSFDSYISKHTEKIKKSVSGREIHRLLNKEISQGLNTLGLLRLAVLFRNVSLLNSTLCTSNAVRDALKDIHRGLHSLNRKITEKSFYKVFNASGDRFFETALLLAFKKSKDVRVFYRRAKEYAMIKNKKLVNGNDVQRILSIKQGKKVGDILKKLKEQQFKGKVKTRHEAERWIQSNLT
jgi:poly(A) polymerase